jgi:hypothetical protein
MSKLRFLKDRAAYPKETRRVELGDYHEDFRGDFIDVWVNFDRRTQDARLKLSMEAVDVEGLPATTEQDREARDVRVAKLNENMWKFHSEWWGLPVEDVKALWEIDTVLYSWIVSRAVALREEYIEERKKAARGSTDT